MLLLSAIHLYLTVTSKDIFGHCSPKHYFHFLWTRLDYLLSWGYHKIIRKCLGLVWWDPVTSQHRKHQPQKYRSQQDFWLQGGFQETICWNKREISLLPKQFLCRTTEGMDYLRGTGKREDTGITTAMCYFKNLLPGEHLPLPHPSQPGFQST